MTSEEKLAALEEMLELDEGSLAPELELSSLEEWDSLAALSFIVLMDDEFSKTVTGKQIKAFKTVQDVMNEMEK